METGQVLEVKGKNLRLQMVRNAACGSCKACSIGIDSKSLELEAVNLCGAKKDDVVEIRLETDSFLSAVSIIYGIPLLCLLAGIFVGYLVGGSLATEVKELTAIGMGLLFMALGFLVIRSQNKKFRREKYVPKAVRVVTPANRKG